MRPVIRGDSPVRATSRGGKQDLQVLGYGFWRPHLVRRLGEYCSYCEVPLGVNLAVEHKEPKSDARVDPEDWTNLLLACVNCNSRKLNRDVSMTFPDTKGYALRMLRYVKGPRSRLELFNAGLLEKKTPVKGNAIQHDCVWVEPSNRPLPATAERLKTTIKTMGLNSFAPDDDSDPKMSDRRVLNRTAAWARALDLSARLVALLVPNPRPGADLLVEQIKEAAIATGFWSIWVTVFRAALPQDAQLAPRLEAMFGSAVFPGTNHDFTVPP